MLLLETQVWRVLAALSTTTMVRLWLLQRRVLSTFSLLLWRRLFASGGPLAWRLIWASGQFALRQIASNCLRAGRGRKKTHLISELFYRIVIGLCLIMIFILFLLSGEPEI